MPRYEYIDDKSSKFWEIERDGSEVTTTWGRIGTDGQSKTKDYGSDDKALKEYDKLIASKTKKGYAEAAGGAATPKAKASSSAGSDGPVEQGTDGWQRYEFIEGKSKKFWEVKVDGTQYLTRYGRIGDDGKTTVKETDSAPAAKKEAEKLAASKVKKGYVLKSAGNLGAASRVKSNPELESAILEDRDDLEAYMVYGDWLQSQDDPRGQLITIQAQLIDKPGDKALEKAAADLLTSNVEHFFGDAHEGAREDKPKLAEVPSYRRGKGYPDKLWNFGHFRMDWHCGFVRSLWFEPGYYHDDKGGDECVAILEQFLSHPSARFLKKLSVGDIWDADYEGPDMTLAVKAIVGSPVCANLEVLEFFGGDHDISGVSGDYSAIGKKCKQLKQLTYYGNDITIGKQDFPNMEKLHVYSGGIDGSIPKAIGSAKWPNLIDLDIMFGSEEYGGSAEIGDLKGILSGKNFPKLERLGLKNSEFANEICEALVGSKILEQIQHLDLSMGTLTEDGANVLIENKKLLAHLKTLNLDENGIPEELHEALNALGPDVTIGEQEDPEDVYTAVGE